MHTHRLGRILSKLPPAEIVQFLVQHQRVRSADCLSFSSEMKQFQKRGEKYVDGAKNDFDKAISIWQSLGEHEEAAKAQLLLMRLCRVVDEKMLKMFDAGDSHLTVVTALQGYLERLSEVKAHVHRSEPSSSQIDEMLKEARRKVAEEHPEW